MSLPLEVKERLCLKKQAEKTKYIVVSKNNELLVNHNQISDLTLAEINNKELKNGDKVYVECESAYELLGVFKLVPHEKESNHCHVIKTDYNNKVKIFKKINIFI